MLWLLLSSLVPSCVALVCFNCGDYMGVRSVCSASTSCTGTRCLIVHLNNSTSFAADCYVAPTQTEDFCWTDTQNRTLCSCKTKFCNSPTAVENMTTSPTNLLPEVAIDTMLLSIATTTPLPVVTTSIGSTGETLSPVTGDTGLTGEVSDVTTVATGPTGETATGTGATASAPPGSEEPTVSPTPALSVPEGNSTAAPVATTTKSGTLYRIPLLVIISSLLL